MRIQLCTSLAVISQIFDNSYRFFTHFKGFFQESFLISWIFYKINVCINLCMYIIVHKYMFTIISDFDADRFTTMYECGKTYTYIQLAKIPTLSCRLWRVPYDRAFGALIVRSFQLYNIIILQTSKNTCPVVQAVAWSVQSRLRRSYTI